jgi:hypothetical protein
MNGKLLQTIENCSLGPVDSLQEVFRIRFVDCRLNLALPWLLLEKY